MDDLTNEDWQQIALFYRQKFADLELQVLAMELKLKKVESNPEPADDE